MNEGPEVKWVERVLGRPGLWLAFGWGLAEGTLFFVVPDVAITLAALFRPRRALLHLSAAVGGAVLAGALLFAWASADGASARAAVHAVPFVPASMFEQVKRSYEGDGVWALFQGPRYGIPYKVYAVLAPGRVPLGTFLLATVPARVARLLLSGVGFAIIGLILRKLKRDRHTVLVSVHLLLWTGFYAYYWSVI